MGVEMKDIHQEMSKERTRKPILHVTYSGTAARNLISDS